MKSTMTRYRAAAIYLGISTLLAGTVLAIMLALWYPAPYFEAMGGGRLALLIIGIDVILGPLLVLVIYNPAKKELRFDMAVLITIQLVAWGYGNFVMFQARPAYVVYAVGVFRVAAANELEPELLAQAQRVEYRTVPLGGPVIVGAAGPTDAEERSTLVLAAASGVDLHVLPKYYVPYDTVRADAARRGKPLADLKANGEQAAAIERFLASSGRTADSLRALPLLAKAEEMSVVVDAASGDVVAVLPVITP